jgi:hypothetical protein
MEENTTTAQTQEQEQKGNTPNSRLGVEVRKALEEMAPKYKVRIFVIVMGAFAIMLLLKIIKYFAL